MRILILMERGGWMMWVILAVSVVALAITLDRVFVLYLRSRLNVGGLSRTRTSPGPSSPATYEPSIPSPEC
jgi:hypothetical protein